MTNQTFARFSEVEDFLRSALYVPQKANTFPPYNLLNSVDDNQTRLQLAVAGYKLDDVSIVLEDGKLIIEGNKQEQESKDWLISHQGISAKAFSLKFNINRSFDVKSATIADGILEILLERVEGSKKKISIEQK